MCPVASFQKYINKLHPMLDALCKGLDPKQLKKMSYGSAGCDTVKAYRADL